MTIPIEAGALAPLALVELKVALLLTLGGLTALGLWRASAAARHLAWTVALGAALILPPLAVLPGLGVPVSGLGVLARAALAPLGGAGATAPALDPPPATAPATVPGGVAEAARADGQPAGPAPTAYPPVTASAGGEASAVVSGPAHGSAERSAPAHGPAAHPAPMAAAGQDGRGLRAWVPALFAAWAAGTLLLLGLLALSLARVRAMARSAPPFPAGRVHQRCSALSSRMGLGEPPALLAGPAGSMPLAWGVRRPVVMLPSDAGGWSAARLDAVLLHELAHVRRRDVAAQLLAEAARALHWPNPLVWLAGWRLTVERERACDDRVLAAGARPSAYAAELLELARSLRPTHDASMAALAMARRSDLPGRLRALLDDARSRAGVSRRSALGAGSLALVVALPLSLAVPGGGPRPPEGPSGATGAAPDAGVAAFLHGGGVLLSVDAGSGTADVGGAGAPTPDGTPSRVEAAAAAASAPVQASAAASPSSRPAPPCRDGSRSGSINHTVDDGRDRQRITWRSGSCQVEVRVDGEVRFSGDLRSIVSMERGSRLLIEVRDGGDRRSLEVQAGADGPVYDWRVDGDRRPFDAQAQAWLSETLLWLARNTGMAATERVQHLLAGGGADAVLSEVAEVPSDYVRALYLSALLERERLQPSQLARVVALTEDMDSDHYRAEVLGSVAREHPLDARMADAFARAASAMDSDHYRAQVLGLALESGKLDGTAAARVLTAAGEMDSDHYRAEILTRTVRTWTLGPELRSAYLRALRAMDSDHYREQTLAALLEQGGADGEEATVVLELAAEMGSDHYRSRLLERIPLARLADREVQTAFARAAAGMDSDHYKSEVLGRLVAAGPDPEVLAMVLVTARTLDSDHYLSELLIDIARRHTLSAPLHDALMEAARTIGSDHYYGRVMRALERR